MDLHTDGKEKHFYIENSFSELLVMRTRENNLDSSGHILNGVFKISFIRSSNIVLFEINIVAVLYREITFLRQKSPTSSLKKRSKGFPR